MNVVRWGGMKKVYEQRERAKQELEWWDKLHSLSDNNDIKGFYSTYVEYLEWANIVSDYRRIIYKMAKLVNETLTNI